MADIQYLNYGDLQIEKLAFLNKASNEVQNYVQKLPWSNKRKLKFMSAYSDIMSRGINGASNSTGQWVINVGGNPIDLNSKDKKDKEMYQEAAYFIQQQMAGLPTKASEEEKKEEDKSKLPVFDNDTFKTGFLTQISNDYFGGSKDIKTSDWNEYDKRDDKGIRGRTERANMLIKSLEKYALNLELNKDKYNFEDSPFGSLDEFKNRIANARKALIDTPTDTDDDFKTLNALGLNASDWFNNGSGDPSGQYITLSDGTLKELTYGQLAEYNQKLAKLKAKQDAIKKQELDKLNKGVLTYSFNNNPIDAVHNTKVYNNWISLKYNPQNGGMLAFDNRVQLLLEKSYNNGNGNGLTSQERKELGNMIHYIRTNNPKYQQYNLTPEDEGYLNALDFPRLKGKKLLDFVRLPYQTSDGRYTYADKSGNIYFLKPKNLAKLTTTPTFDKSRIQEYNNYIKDFGKSLLQINNETPVLSLDTDILISDITSMLGDIVSLGGGVAGAAGGITTILSDLYGDIRRGKDTWGIIKNLGANIAWGAAGLIPGAKLGKVAKNASRIYAILQSAGILRDPEVQQSWKNLIDGKDITARDFENFKWTLHAITGGTNAARGHLTEKNINKQIKTNNKSTIETLSGNKSITLEQIRKINRIGGRKGQKAAEEAFEREIGAKPKEGTFTFLEESRSGFNPLRYSLRLRNWISNDERLTLSKTNSSVNQLRVNELLELDKSKPFIGIGNPFNRKFWTEGGPNRGGLSFYLKPYTNSGIPKQETTSNNETSSNPQSTTALIESKIPHSKNEIRRDWKNTIERKQFTTNEIKAGNYVINNIKDSKHNVNFNVSEKDSEGFRILTINGKEYKGIKTQKQLLEKIAKAMLDYRTTINNSTVKAGINHKEMGKILRDLKAKGWLKQGGTIDKQKIQKYKEFIKK